MPIISFVIPAYNANEVIVRCLDSIYSLPLKQNEFEVICIDDSSKDNTTSIIEKYAKSHNNLTLLRQIENHRQGAARNRGIAIAKGKYIVCVDSDDESDNGVVQALQLAEEYELDMVAMHYVNVDDHSNIVEKEAIKLDGVFTGVELQTEHPYWCTGPVAYLYKRIFLQNVNYPFASDVLFEDSDFVAVHLYHAKRMMYSAKSAYRVHYNATSTTRTLTYKHIADYILLGERMLKFYHSLNDITSKYSQSILEGGSYNVWMSCKRLFKLSSIRDVCAFYDRIDSSMNRKALLNYSEPAYCWTWWTKLCLKNKHVAIVLFTIGQFGYKLKRAFKKMKCRKKL